MTKLIETLYCPKCESEVKKEPLIREHWCSTCRSWTVGTRISKKDVSSLRFSYDDMGCYMERE